MKKIKKWLFPEKTKWVDISCFDRNGNYYLIQMRQEIESHKKQFRIAKIGFVNDYTRKPTIYDTAFSKLQTG